MFYDQFIKLVDHIYNCGELRYGQVLINLLYKIWPKKYYEIIGTQCD